MRWTEDDVARYLHTQGRRQPADQEGRLPPGPMAEVQLLRRIRTLARHYGWRVYHTYDSRKSEMGFPDLVLVRETVIFAELKSPKGKVTLEQMQWLEALTKSQCGEVYLWRPQDLPAIETRLAQPTRQSKP